MERQKVIDTFRRYLKSQKNASPNPKLTQRDIVYKNIQKNLLNNTYRQHNNQTYAFFCLLYGIVGSITVCTVLKIETKLQREILKPKSLIMVGIMLPHSPSSVQF